MVSCCLGLERKATRNHSIKSEFFFLGGFFEKRRKAVAKTKSQKLKTALRKVTVATYNFMREQGKMLEVLTVQGKIADMIEKCLEHGASPTHICTAIAYGYAQYGMYLAKNGNAEQISDPTTAKLIAAARKLLPTPSVEEESP